MTIVLVHNLGKNIRGGAERVFSTYTTALIAMGNKVVIVSTESFHSAQSFQIHTHAPDEYSLWVPNIISFPRLGALKKWQRFFWHIIDLVNPWSIWQWYHFLKDLQPDIVWTHNLKGLGALPLVLRWFFPTQRWIHTLHDPQLIEPSGLFMIGHEQALLKPSYLQRTWMKVSMWWIGSPTLVTSPTQWLLSIHTQRHYFPLSKSILSKNPSTLTTTTPMITQESPTILWIGQLEIHRGIYFFLNALQTIRRHQPHLPNIIIVGDGRLRDDVTQRCHALGILRIDRQTDEQLHALWARTKFALVTSLCYENAPTVITEAHARGIPVLAPSAGGIPEMIEEGNTGWLYQPNDEGAFIRAFHQALYDARRFPPLITDPTQQVKKILGALL